MPVRYLRCKYCGMFFKPDYRHRHNQKACSRNECRRKRKKEAQKRWLERNADSFRGRYINVKEWRKTHPDYQRNRRRRQKVREIQDAIPEVITAKTIHLPKPGEWLEREIQDTIPLVPFYNSMRYASRRGGEIQDAILPPDIAGYFYMYVDSYPTLVNNQQRYGCWHPPTQRRGSTF
jgi:hypothetical protein